jgi:PAS domain S-box-containing protein
MHSPDATLIDSQLVDPAWLVESAPCALLVVDERQTICFVNAAAEQLFEYAKGELIGKPLDLLLPWALQPAGNVLPEPRKPGNGRDVSGVKKRGDTIPLEVAISHAESAYGPVAVAVLFPVNEHKRREEGLARSNKDLEQFAYIASHDLREPLRMVSSFLGLLVQRYKNQLDNDAQRYIHFAVDGATRMQRLIDGLLVYARVGSQEYKLGAADSDAALRAAWLGLTQVVNQTGAQLRAAALPVVHADPKLLHQLFQLLLDNALKFRHDDHTKAPEISVSGRVLQGERAIISFRDNGIGLDMKHREKIFEVFRRLHEIGKYEGAGMGLAIAKRIVELHHGEISVESEPGAGSTFHVSLPVQAP